MFNLPCLMMIYFMMMIVAVPRNASQKVPPRASEVSAHLAGSTVGLFSFGEVGTLLKIDFTMDSCVESSLPQKIFFAIALLFLHPSCNR